MSTTKREPILYRWWDAEGRLLYVGKSISVFSRIQQHRRNSKFFPEASTMTIERFGTEKELAVAEIAAIRTEGPLYNIAGSIGGEPRRLLINQPVDADLGHWQPYDGTGFFIGQMIRWQADGHTHIGLVDDEDCCEPEMPEDDGNFWYIIADTGELHELTEWELPLLKVDAWVSIDGSTPAGLTDAYYERIRQAVA